MSDRKDILSAAITDRTKRSPLTLGAPACFWVAAAVVLHTLWTSAAPAMTYPLYGAKWHLTPTVTTAIFAIYPLVVVSVLILFGDLSDHIGRRPTMLLGLGASLIGVLLFAVAPNIDWIFLGRVFMGFGVGLSAAPSAAAVVEFSPLGQSRRAGAIVTAAQALGLALALLVGGGLIQYAPFPLRLNFWVLFAVIGAIFVATWFLPREARNEASEKWRLRFPAVPKTLHKIFAVSATAVTAGYALGAVMMSVGAQIARDLIGSRNALVNGATISVFAVVGGITAILSKHMPPRSGMIWGGIVAAIGMALLVLAVSQHTLFIFLSATGAAGISYSFLFQGGLNLINAHAPSDQRAATLSGVFLIAYLGQGMIALALGKAATAWGLKVAIQFGSLGLALLSLVAIALAFSLDAKVSQPVAERA